MSADLPRAPMPYIGLRPFQREDADLFFGREDQVKELVGRLESHRFLAVVGTSGCGKSSLVRAGLIPSLENGFMVTAGEAWRFATLLPGDAPVKSLAAALVDSGALGAGHATEDATVAVAATLRRGPMGLVELLDEVTMEEGSNLLIIVDQFEEIFRYHRLGAPEEAAAFVNLLLAATASPGRPVYVVLTMRSDYLGDCAVFPDLPEALNDSQFLVPRLSRSQLETAISGPAALFDADIEEALLNRLLNELGSDPDQLPLMQHALMRMWTVPDETPDPDEDGKVLTLDHFEEIGGLANALSNHATEVERSVTADLRDKARAEAHYIVQILFRCLCDATSEKQDLRRPTPVADIAAIAGVDPDRVIAVVEFFRRPDCSFIMPPAGVPLTPDSVLDISHESLIRNWETFQQWRQSEAERREEFRRIVDVSRRWKHALREDPDALSRGAVLEAQVAWSRLRGIGPAWAKRYGPAADFELAQEYLAASETKEAERKEQDRLRAIRREEKRRKFLLGVGIASVLFLILAVTMTVLYVGLVRSDEDRESKATELERSRAELVQAETKVFKRETALIALQADHDRKTERLTKRQAAFKKQEERKLLELEKAHEESLAALQVEQGRSETLRDEARKQEAAARVAKQEAHVLTLAGKAGAIASGPAPKLIDAMLIVLQAHRWNPSSQDTARLLRMGIDRMLRVLHKRASGFGKVRGVAARQANRLDLVTEDGHIERLDLANQTLRRVASIPSDPKPIAMLHRPGDSAALIVREGLFAELRRADGMATPLGRIMGHGYAAAQDLFLVWGNVPGERPSWRVFGVEAAEPIAGGTLPCAPAGKNAVAVGTTGAGYAIACADGRVLSGPTPAGEPRLLHDAKAEIREADVAPGGAAVLLLTLTGDLLHVPLPGRSAAGTSLGTQISSFSCAWSEGHLLVGEGERLLIWDLATLTPRGSLGVPDMDAVVRPQFDDGLLVWTDQIGTVHVWDLDLALELGVAPLDTYARWVHLEGTGPHRQLWVLDEAGQLLGWHVDREAKVRLVMRDFGYGGTRLSRDGALLQVVPRNGEPVYIDTEALAARENVPEFLPGSPSDVLHGEEMEAFSAGLTSSQRGKLADLEITALLRSNDDEHLLAVSADFRLWLIHLGEEKTSKIPLGIGGDLFHTRFSGDGAFVLSAADGKGLKIWDIEGRPVAQLPLRGAGISWLGMPGAGRPVFYQTDSRLFAWNWSPPKTEDLRDEICRRLPRTELEPSLIHGLGITGYSTGPRCPETPVLTPSPL